MTLTTARVQFIIPKEATNLIINPSFGFATTGYTTFGAGTSIARVTTQSRRGIASCEITTATNVASGIYYTIALTNAVQYSFSADILDVVGQTFNLFIASATDGTLASGNTTWTGTGYWKRRSVTWTATSGATFYLFVTRSSVASTTKFYVDGWQLETGAESTYLDGDMVGYVTGETAYRWNGTNHASTSWRSGQTRSGGTYVSLSTYAKLLTIVGLGMAPVSNIGLASTMGGSYYQNSVVTERPFSLLVNINGSDYATIQKAREGITACVKPDKTVYRQPLLMQYDELDGNGLEIAETLEIPCLYDGGMEGNTTPANERISLNFRMFMPMIQQQGEKGAALGFQETITNANQIIMRKNGAWLAMGTGAETGGGTIVYAIRADNRGSVYAGGNFLNMGGVAAADRFAKWDGSAWSALQAGFNATVNAIAIGPDSLPYAGGGFTQAVTGPVTVNYISKWNGTDWTALATGLDSTVLSIAFDGLGNLYAGGEFQNANTGPVVCNRIAKWNGSAWSALATGFDDLISSVAVGPDGSVYVGGSFHVANTGSVTVNHIAKWNGTTWSALQTGLNDRVWAMAFGPDGALYIGGDFTIANTGSIALNYIAKWNGSTFEALGSGVSNTVLSLHVDNSGNVYAGGLFDAASGIPLPDRMAVWNGSAWTPMDVNLPGTAQAYAITSETSNNIYVGGLFEGSAVPAPLTYPTAISATSYPKFTFGGAGVLAQIKNYTTGKAIYFNLTMLVGETAYLNLDPQNLYFWSVYRGSLMSTILPGSDLDFFLVPGSNNISAYYSSGTTAGSYISMTWKDQYHSIDGAVR
jgi:hypothetical protein